MNHPVWVAFAAILGGVIGSFLNACIHRMPRGISLRDPKRSFCPACKKLIPWYENLPVVSWVVLRGRCSGCGERISVRYPLVELLVAALFVAAWLAYGIPLAPVYWVFLSLLVAATFIDIEHFIIPDEITWGGTAAGILLSLLVPAMMNTDSRLAAPALSLAGAALGFGLLWLVVEGGKLAFGKKRHRFAEGTPFTWTRDGDRADIVIGEESLRWEEIFSRESDELVLECGELEIDGEIVPGGGRAKFRYDRVLFGSTPRALDDVDVIRGTLSGVVIPREAMGFGDVKFIAAIGAFLGWQAVLFTIFASSIIGCIAGLAGIFLARDRSGARIPFGPFLALGAAWWIFGGQTLFHWYFDFFGANP
jgi:leader peptidase (prepilin peptidase) / N-methyltransferase